MQLQNIRCELHSKLSCEFIIPKSFARVCRPTPKCTSNVVGISLSANRERLLRRIFRHFKPELCRCSLLLQAKLARNHSIVLLTPSSVLTFGSHCKSLRALP